MSYSMFGRWAEARNIALRGALVFIALLSVANAATFTAQDASPVTCAGNLTVEKGGVVRCSDGASLLSSCAGDVVIDTKGAIRCPTVVGLPVCTLAAVPNSIASGASSTLTATCTGTPTSYTWTGGTCAGKTTSTCTVTPTTTTAYTVKGTSAAGTSTTAASATVTVTSSGLSAPNCSLDQTQVGSKISLSANCTPEATSYNWGGTGFSSSTKFGLIDPPLVTTTYYVTGSNAAGAGNLAQLTITVSTSTPTCTLTANPAFIDKNGTSDLTANCSPSATNGYTWTGGTCAGLTVATCTTQTLAAAGVTTYTVAGTNATGTGSPASATLTAAKPTCTVTASPQSVAPDGQSTLTASCSPSVGTAYSWSDGVGAICANTTTCPVTPGNDTKTYTVTGSNSLGASDPASTTVTVLAPNCTLTAVPSTIAPGETSFLTASCSPAAASFIWTGGTCVTEVDNTCTVTGDNTPGTTPYSVVGRNAKGDSNPAGATVTVAAPTCTLTATPATVTLNEKSTLTASCSPLTGISYIWTGGTCAGSTTSCEQTPQVEGIETYTVKGHNLAGDGAVASATVTASTVPCTEIPVDWSAGLAAGGGTPRQTSNATQQQAFRFTPWPNPGGSITISYSHCNTDVAISTSACDFGATLGANCVYPGSMNPSLTIQTNDQPLIAGRCVLPAGVPFFVNVRQPVGTGVNGCNYYLSY